MNVRRFLIAAPALVLVSCSTAVNPNLTAIVGATLIDGNGGAPVPDSVVVVDGGTIRAAGPRSSIAIPADAAKIDAKGRFITPGLVDLHVHLGSRGGPAFVANDYTHLRVEANLNAYLYFGVTTVRSIGTERVAGMMLRASQEQGISGGARLFTAGRGFTARGGHPSQEIGDIARQVIDTEDARGQVRELASERVDLIKIWIDSLHGTAPVISDALIQAICDQAKIERIPVVAHIFSLAQARHFLDVGGSGFVHMIRDTANVPEEFVERLAKGRVVFTPTLVRQELAWLYNEQPHWLTDPDVLRTIEPAVIDAVRKAVEERPAAGLQARTEFTLARSNSKALAEKGVLMGIGSDGGSAIDFPGAMTHREMEIFVEAGFKPDEVLTAATRNGAIALGREKEFGTVEAGKRADLLLLAADPLADIKNLRKIERLMQNGRWVERGKLNVR